MKQSTKTLLAWGLLILVFLAIWQVFTPESPRTTPPPSTEFSGYPLIVAVVLGAAVFFTLRQLTRAGAALRSASQSYSAAILDEDFPAAERAAELTPRWPAMYKMIRSYHLGFAAYAAGRFDVAEERLRLHGRRGTILFRSDADDTAAVTFARRAVVRAALDRDDLARADIAAARAIGNAGRGARALAAFAEIVLLARRRDLPAVREKLEEGEACFGLNPRENAVLAAIDAFASAGGGTAYRRRVDDATREPPSHSLATWVEALVPGVAPFLLSPPGRTEIAAPDEPLDDAARARVASERDAANAGHRSRNWSGWLMLAALVGAILLGRAMPEAIRITATTGSVVLALVLALLGFWRRSSRSWAIGRRAADLDQSARPDDADAMVRPLSVSSSDATIASVLERRALYALHEGDAKEALARCDKGLAHLRRAETTALAAAKKTPTRTAIGSFGFTHHAEIHAELTVVRAMTLAALARSPEAHVEMSLIATPSVAARFLFALYGSARAGDVAAVVDLADRAGRDILLGPFEIALLDAGRAASGDTQAARSLERKIRKAPAIAKFLGRVAPNLAAKANKAGDQAIAVSSAALV